MQKAFVLLISIIITVFLLSCNDDQVQLTQPAHNILQSGMEKSTGSDIDMDRIAGLVANVNSMFEAAGSTIRLDEAWFFTIGHGTPEYQRLRTGSRWTYYNVTYVLDESDYTKDVPREAVEAALVRGFNSWNDIENTGIYASRISDNKENFDVLDGTFDHKTGTFDLIDVKSSILEGGYIFPVADIVVGGWIYEEYFSIGLGSADIIGVTWTFSDVDSDGDGYRDRLYVEQFYNSAFEWTNTDAVYLDFNSPIDIESIAVHENGHAHGLGHFGGPVGDNQPFKLQPNGKVFDPEAVMNPFYLGGEKRTPFGTDISALRTMYAQVH